MFRNQNNRIVAVRGQATEGYCSEQDKPHAKRSSRSEQFNAKFRIGSEEKVQLTSVTISDNRVKAIFRRRPVKILSLVDCIPIKGQMTGKPQCTSDYGSPRTDRLIDASIQWAKRIMSKIDSRWPVRTRCTRNRRLGGIFG